MSAATKLPAELLEEAMAEVSAENLPFAIERQAAAGVCLPWMPSNRFFSGHVFLSALPVCTEWPGSKWHPTGVQVVVVGSCC